MDRRTRRALLAPLAINVALPLGVYYILRAQGSAQWQALLLSSVIPAAHAAVTAVVRRRVDFFDLFVVILLAASAGTSLISGNPRVLLLKDAALPAMLGLWFLGTLFMSRPSTFQFGEKLRSGAALEEAERAWREMPEYRSAHRGLTILWACTELLDATLSLIESLTLPVDVVPVIGRFQSLGLIALAVVLTTRSSRRFRARHGISLFGTGGPGERKQLEEAPSRV
ncbi:hypothetical protein CTZ27_26895 [Streptomyces griseocarneus]|nr:hypothetical protein CTZ27_26895 [Streptomyces griseocarneus]